MIDTKQNFADDLINEVNGMFEHAKQAGDIVKNMGQDKSDEPLSPFLIKHWLNFAVYYEKQASIFIGHWLKTTVEDDAFVSFAHQIEDEANHYRWLKAHLADYTDCVDSFQPPEEWSFLMEEFYPKLPTLVERLSAHNIAAETGALGFSEMYFGNMPKKIQATMEKVIKDEKFHISFAKRLLNKYCDSDEKRKKAIDAAKLSLQYMEKAREAFVNI